jgi:ABC-2 type transport system ATP-binding protein
MATPSIVAQNLSKHYNNRPALEGVTISVPHGNIGLLGENGAGKTTFIKLSLGLLKPTSGSAAVLGLDVAQKSLELRRFVGYMPEDDCLPPDMSALDFVVRMGCLSGLPREAAAQRSYDVLYLVGLGEERYRQIGGYSVGMKQRVKLAQALVHDPKLILLDEPTSGLDPKGRDEMLDLIRAVREKMGISLLLSTHLLLDVERVCDYVVIMRAGKVISHGTLDQLLQGATQSILIRVLGDEQQFVQEMQSKGVSITGENSEYQVAGAGEEIFDVVLQAASKTGVQLRRLEQQSRSLEDYFTSLHHAKS